MSSTQKKKKKMTQVDFSLLTCQKDVGKNKDGP